MHFEFESAIPKSDTPGKAGGLMNFAVSKTAFAGVVSF
jgi:hypothetical protein